MSVIGAAEARLAWAAGATGLAAVMVTLGATWKRKRSSAVTLKILLNVPPPPLAGCRDKSTGAAAFSDEPAGLIDTTMMREGPDTLGLARVRIAGLLGGQRERPHVVVRYVRQIFSIARPVAATFLSFPSAMNPMDWLSADQNRALFCPRFPVV